MAATEKGIKPDSTMQMSSYDGPVVDLSNRGLHKLDANFSCAADTHTLILDQNHIIKLEHLEKNAALQQLSVACNRLVRMMGVSRLTNLKVLNLPNNSIGYIEGLKELTHLEWLNLAGNNIKVIDQLNSCIALQHLDLSDNNISHMGDLTKLSTLKTLLLHGNIITTLRTVPAHLPPNLTVLSLAENEIRDLNEVSYLAPLHDLEQLSIMNNPCVMATPSLPGCDYRPYVVSWCLNLKVLDGYVVSQKEGLKAEWLYSQGKGRTYRPGQHVQLVQYLATVCPLTATSALQSAEDAKLERILSKQRQHQRQLLQTSHRSSLSPTRPTHLDVEQNWHNSPRNGVTQPEPSNLSPQTGPEPVLQVNSWLGTSSGSVPALHAPLSREEPLILEDVQTDEEKLHGSLLSSESAFLPVSSDVQSPSRSDSEEEDVDEPDSLAPEGPARSRPQTAPGRDAASHTLICPPPGQSPVIVESSQLNGVNENTSIQNGDKRAQTDGSKLSKINADQNLPLDTHLASRSGQGISEVESEVRGEQRVAQCRPHEAAVRIQAWWRGHWTRHHHPQAKEVRSEIRLRRMQEHIVFLTAELDRVRKQQEEDRLQRLVQEEAVKFLWKQFQAMVEWQGTVKDQLSSLSPMPNSAVGASFPAAPVSATEDTIPPIRSELSLPESGFHSPGERQGLQEDSLSSTATAGSPETVRSLGMTVLSPGAAGDSQDASLLEQYLSSVQRQDEEEEDEEEGAGDRTGAKLRPPSLSPLKNSDSSSVVVEKMEEAGKQCPLLESKV